MGAIERLQGLNCAKLFGDISDAAFASEACGINHRVSLATALEFSVDAVTSSTGLIVGDHTLLAQQPIHERRFTDIGTPYHRYLYAVTRFFKLVFADFWPIGGYHLN